MDDAATPEAGELFQIKHHVTGEVLFDAPLAADVSAKSLGIKIGAVVKLALKSGADLRGADLGGADLSGADLSGASAVIAAGQPNGFWAYGYREKDTGTLRVKVGCRDKTMAEAREYWSPAHPRWSERQEIPIVLDQIEAIARLRWAGGEVA